MKQLSTYETRQIVIKLQKLTDSFQATDAGARKIQIVYRDKLTGHDTDPVTVTRAQLAKYYSNYQVIGARDGVTVVEL